MKNTAFVFLVLITQWLNLPAQHGATILTPEELARQKELMVENFPNVFDKENIIGIQRLDSSTYKVKFTRYGVYYEAFISAGRTEGRGLLLIETDQLIEDKKIPDVIKAGIAGSKYKTWHIDKAFIATTPYSGELYRVDVYKNNSKKRKKIYFDDMGHFHNEPAK